ALQDSSVRENSELHQRALTTLYRSSASSWTCCRTSSSTSAPPPPATSCWKASPATAASCSRPRSRIAGQVVPAVAVEEVHLAQRSEEHTSELQSREKLVWRRLLVKN